MKHGGRFRTIERKNVLCVEMEAVGLFTIARYRNIKAAAVYIISDTFNKEEWNLGWSENKISFAVSELFNMIIESIK
jgi:purine-nucleoside phosphorylase